MADPNRLGFQLFTQHLTALRANSNSGERSFVSSTELKFSWDCLTNDDRLQWIQRAVEGQSRAHPKTPPKSKPRHGSADTSASHQGQSNGTMRKEYITGISRRGALLATMPRRKPQFFNERARRLAERREDFRPILPAECDVDSEDDEIGVPLHVDKEETEKCELEAKYHHDRQLVFESIMEQTGGCLEKIKNLRFLLASVQTFGNADNVCMVAEYAMNEFNLQDGVIDRFSTIVGPWEVSNEVQRSRATFHSHETHRIPLAVNKCKMDKRQLVMEILGRSEPSVAYQQGLRVGLYRDELEGLDERMNRLYVGEKDLHHLVDENNGRWIICLPQEFHYMTASMKHLQTVIGLEYKGFPTSKDRYVLANAFVDALADCLGGSAIPECPGWLKSLGSHLPEEFATPWERSGELFCERHRPERNSCCATVTASRATFIMIHSLEDLLKE